MKKLLIVLMVVAMASFLMTGCFVTPPTEVAVTGVTLVPATLALTAGGATRTLLKTVAPADATDPRVTWASSAEAVATVALGVVTPIAEGTATITVTTVDGGFTDTCIVTVSAAPAVPVAVTGVTLDEATLAFTVGDAPVTLVATVVPATATDTSIIWASSNKTVAIVAAGVVTPLNTGISAITATTVDGGLVATCVVTVTAEGEPMPVSITPVITWIAANSIDLSSDDTQYINEAIAADGIFVWGRATNHSEVNVYIGGVVVGTSTTYGIFEFFSVFVAEDNLGDDGEKTLYATATELGLAESAHSTEYAFTLDTVAPEIEKVVAVVEDPIIVGVTGTVTVTFSEAIDEDSAEDDLDWIVSDITDLTVIVTVDTAELTSDNKVVELGVITTIIAPVFGDVIRVAYEDSIADPLILTDLAGNPAVESTEYCLLLPSE